MAENEPDTGMPSEEPKRLNIRIDMEIASNGNRWLISPQRPNIKMLITPEELVDQDRLFDAIKQFRQEIAKALRDE